jgi:hypothetical protein
MTGQCYPVKHGCYDLYPPWILSVSGPVVRATAGAAASSSLREGALLAGGSVKELGSDGHGWERGTHGGKANGGQGQKRSAAGCHLPPLPASKVAN